MTDPRVEKADKLVSELQKELNSLVTPDRADREAVSDALDWLQMCKAALDDVGITEAESIAKYSVEGAR